jgi:fructan beta-fructosidase
MMQLLKQRVRLGVLILLLTGSLAMQNIAVYQEQFRPQFHYSPPNMWMNDPNGMIYHEGEYHLFYQYDPYSTQPGPMHWGHAVSRDLVHWETLPIALYPDSNGAIWSGSVVIDTENTSGFGANAMVAIFTYQPQTQGVAYSNDNGRTWTMYDGNPVLPAIAPDFRDPKVFWHEETNQWVMIIVAGREAQIYTSPDLKDWTYASRFAEGHLTAIWEVPDLFPLELDGKTHWIMLISVGSFGPAGGNGIQYFIGDFDGTTFTNANPESTILWLDYGPDNYAGTTWNNLPIDQRLYIGWMSNWAYARETPTTTWRGANTLPREFSLRHTPEGVRLVQKPVDAIEQLRHPIGTWDNLTVTDELVLEGVQGRTLELIADITPGTAERLGLIVHRGENVGTRILYNSRQEQLLVSRSDTTSAGTIPSFNTAYGAPLVLDNGLLRLRIFVDESSVEVFAQDGLVTISSQTFVEPPADGVALYADNGSFTLNHLEIYALDSIWQTTP